MTFSPEIGQVAFGNTEWFEHNPAPYESGLVSVLGGLVIGAPDEVPGYTIGASPCVNAAAAFANDTFAIRAYCWCDGNRHPGPDEGGPGCPPNFHHYATDYRMSWYKYAGRGESTNKPVSVWEMVKIFEDCVASLRRQTGLN